MRSTVFDRSVNYSIERPSAYILHYASSDKRDRPLTRSKYTVWWFVLDRVRDIPASIPPFLHSSIHWCSDGLSTSCRRQVLEPYRSDERLASESYVTWWGWWPPFHAAPYPRFLYSGVCGTPGFGGRHASRITLVSVGKIQYPRYTKTIAPCCHGHLLSSLSNSNSKLYILDLGRRIDARSTLEPNHLSSWVLVSLTVVSPSSLGQLLVKISQIFICSPLTTSQRHRKGNSLFICKVWCFIAGPRRYQCRWLKRHHRRNQVSISKHRHRHL